MPELPEVETIVRNLKRSLLHRHFTTVTVMWSRTVANQSPVDFIKSLQGTTIINIQRRGKYLIFVLDSGKKLIVHLRMSGRFSLQPVNEERESDKHTRVRMLLDDTFILDFIDQRKFGRFYLVDDAKIVTGKLGPEPLSSDFSVVQFSNMLSKRSAQVKTLLLDQHFIAGLGNIYVNEALWHAQIHPQRKANTLTSEEIERLYHAIIQVLQRAVANGGTSLDDRQYTYPNGHLGNHQQYLRVYDRAGETCERCGYMLTKIKQAQRSTYFCPQCQPANDVSDDIVNEFTKDGA